MKRIFFYGLFMDVGLLRRQGLSPTPIGPAALPGYRIRIGERATLVPSPGFTAHGVVMDLEDDEAQLLYSAKDLADYVPETVRVFLSEAQADSPALCYNLAPDRLGAAVNSTYAERLAALVRELGFPRHYAEEVALQGSSMPAPD